MMELPLLTVGALIITLRSMNILLAWQWINMPKKQHGAATSSRVHFYRRVLHKGPYFSYIIQHFLKYPHFMSFFNPEEDYCSYSCNLELGEDENGMIEDKQLSSVSKSYMTDTTLLYRFFQRWMVFYAVVVKALLNYSYRCAVHLTYKSAQCNYNNLRLIEKWARFLF